MLLKSGERVSIGKRGIRLLEILADHPGETIPKADLLDAGWPGLAVEESNLSVQIALLRKAIGASFGGGDWIETIPRVGYRFRGDEWRGASTNREPVLAVLPFMAIGRDRDVELFAEGLSDELTNALSRISGFAVIARSSSFTCKGAYTDARQIASELGVTYVLEGSVRQTNGRLRVTTGLIDGGEGRQIWAERFDRVAADILSVQDDLRL